MQDNLNERKINMSDDHLNGCGVYTGHRCSCVAKRIKLFQKKSQKKGKPAKSAGCKEA